MSHFSTVKGILPKTKTKKRKFSHLTFHYMAQIIYSYNNIKVRSTKVRLTNKFGTT